MNEEISQTIRGLLQASQLLPSSYAEYQPLVVDALMYFFSRLRPERMDEVIAAQAALPYDAGTDERLIALLRQCPTLHKLGQVVSHERGLPVALRERLQTLESLTPTSDVNEIAAYVRSEVGHIDGLEISGEALAEGSVAVVVPFTFTDLGSTRRGVFKVLKPRAVERMHEELAIWPDLSPLLEERSATYGLPVLDYRTILGGVGNLLLQEIQLDREQQNLLWAADFYADMDEIVIPQLLPFSTKNVTAMERIDGKKVTDISVSKSTKRKLAKSLIRMLIAQPFWNASPNAGRFHADPHAGNLFVTDDGRLAVLDWALVSDLAPNELADVVRALLGAITLDENEVIAAVRDLGKVIDETRLRAEVIDAISRVRRGVFPGFFWFTKTLDRLARSGAVIFPEASTLFRKSLLTLTGVVDDVSDEVSVDRVLIETGVKEFVVELRARLAADDRSRAFGSHVSNTDLVQLFTSVTWIPARFWLDTLRDLSLGKPAIPFYKVEEPPILAKP
jgi:ubiquinone biosynthesis protein